MNIYILHPLLNILLFAIPLALTEIFVEKSHGWGSGFSKERWFAKSIFHDTKLGSLITKITKLEPPLNYHILIGWILFPAVFIFEYIYWVQNIWLVLSSFFVALVVADISWFLCNWYFDSWTQLTKGAKGSIFWHKSWTKIAGGKYLPTSYFTWAGLAILFSILAQIFS